jgi:uncharacterized protein YjbI with pentapeptide repeats
MFSADLRGADLRGADLSGADPPNSDQDFGISTVAEAKLGGAMADRSTQWPSGFDWRAAGVKLK